MIDRDFFFSSVRDSPFGGSMTQGQVDGLSYLVDTWELYYAEDHPKNWREWLAYCLATVFHETDRKMRPIEEYGQGEGHSYADPAGPYDQSYYGRGHVMLTWHSNYERGEKCLLAKHDMTVPMVQYPHRMLEDETSAIILFEGSIDGWFTGVSLGDYFNADAGLEDPYNARRIINGTDCAAKIEDYYWAFKEALREAD